MKSEDERRKQQSDKVQAPIIALKIKILVDMKICKKKKNGKVFCKKNPRTKKRKKEAKNVFNHDLICTVEVKFELFAIVCMNISLISLFSAHY